MSRILLLLIILPFLGYAQTPFTSLEKQLFRLPDLLFQSIDTPEGFEAAYELHVRQPVDHTDPSQGYFYQRVYLSHRSFDAPTVIITEGYDRSRNRVYELTKYLEANQVDVEHRYFGTSVPDSLDYRFLNLKQATADLHRIRELLGQLYSSDWVSTGISKGGQTTIFYRYLYPDDVTASVPYVAPLNLALKEQRIYNFLDTIGSDACRKAIYDTQVSLLKNRKQVLTRLEWYAKGKGYKFQYLNLEEAFEYAVLEYPFSFWQNGHDCNRIPNLKTDGLDALIEHFQEVIDLVFYTDAVMTAYASHYWQAGTEMGYYGFETDDFKGLLKTLSGEPSAVFMPGKASLTFQPDGLVQAAYDWTQTEAERMIYIYGGTDTWTATGVPPSNKAKDSHWFILPGADHSGARIRNMNPSKREQLLTTLEGWLSEKD